MDHLLVGSAGQPHSMRERRATCCLDDLQAGERDANVSERYLGPQGVSPNRLREEEGAERAALDADQPQI